MSDDAKYVDALLANGRLREERDRLREALRMALPHVKSAGDDTLAMVIRAALAKEEPYSVEPY